MSVHATIDLDQALKKIATRQSLNDVHFLVQLVRHALELTPKSIHISEQNETWTLSHDGASPQLLEVSAIMNLINGNGSIDDLTILETQFGVALLSCFVNFTHTTLSFSNTTLTQKDGRYILLPTGKEINGYHLSFMNNGKLETDPYRELLFYCSSVKVPLTYNSIEINHPKRIPPLVFQSIWETDHGEGLVGIPHSGSDSTFHFYKNGVLFGVKHFTPKDGRLLYGYWDVPGTSYESDFEESIETALNLLQQQGQHLYNNLGDYYSELEPIEKKRIKQILLNVSQQWWKGSLSSMGLFNLGHGTFNLSLSEIKSRIENELSFPFQSTLSQNKSNKVATLSPEDVYFLKEKMGLPLRML